jgi:hypothetical protein
MKTSAPASASSAEPRSPRGFVSRASAALNASRPGRSGWSAPCRSQETTSPYAGGEQLPRRRSSRHPSARDDDAHIREPLADDAKPVQQCGEDDDRSAVLVVVEDGDCRAPRTAAPRFDLEAARRGDVLQVDPAEDGRECGNRPHELVRVGRREADRPASMLANSLNRIAFPLHHRQRRIRADVAEPENRGAVGDDRDRVLLDRQVPHLFGLVGDCAADARDARRVGHREVVARLQRHLRDDLELAAEVEQEGAVGDVLDLDPVEGAHRLDDAGEVRFIVGEHGDVADLLAALDPDEVDRAEQAAGFGDRRRKPGERSRPVLQVDAERRAERRRQVRDAHAVDPHPTVTGCHPRHR